LIRKVFLIAIAACIAMIFIFGPLFSENKKNFQFKKQPEIQQIKPKKPVKVKLKRLAGGNYTWDITGDDVDEIVKADRELRKLLKIE
jgi:hypothetical protein